MPMRIVFIGSGNIATFFAPGLKKVGHEIVQVYSRNIVHAQFLAEKTMSLATDQLADLTQDADVYILAVKDDALAEVAGQVHFPGKVVIHCAGALPLDLLTTVSEHAAVIWSLYSIKAGNLPKSDHVPLIVEGHTDIAVSVAEQLAHDLSDNVLLTDFVQRKILHLNAVFANNFTNHLLAIAQKLCEEYKLPFPILYPIIRQTIDQISYINPSESQTGPAIRGDNVTVTEHLKLLQKYPDWQELYSKLTDSIRKHP